MMANFGKSYTHDGERANLVLQVLFANWGKDHPQKRGLRVAIQFNISCSLTLIRQDVHKWAKAYPDGGEELESKYHRRSDYEWGPNPAGIELQPRILPAPLVLE